MSHINIETIAKWHLVDKKTYQEIGNLLGCSRQNIAVKLKKYFEKHPTLKPVRKKKVEKEGIKGHRRDKNNKIIGIAKILVNGYAARFIERYVKCKNVNCVDCNTGNGHGPYIYLSFRDEFGDVNTKYISKSDKISKEVIAQKTKKLKIKIILDNKQEASK